MMIESVNKSVIGPVLPVKPPEGNMTRVQVRLPGDREEKTPDFSQTADLGANIQNSLNIILNVNLNFSVHEASGQVMVTISDKETGEVIREIPSSEILNLAAKLDEMVGLLFDQKG
ncbi:MAG: flagellar protein FlaG [Thermodesulfobacteriota bacterium]|nr:flagellar protein FlaG [Thermodesulfobacteriota bacterium]